jgi:hypothetical protein
MLAARTATKAARSRIAAIVLAFVRIVVVLTAGATAVWPTSEVRVFGLVLQPTAIAARLCNRILASRDGHREAA